MARALGPKADGKTNNELLDVALRITCAIDHITAEVRGNSLNDRGRKSMTFLTG